MLPQASYGLLLEDRCRTAIIVEVDGAEVRFRLWVVGYSDAPAPAWLAISAVASGGAVAAVRSVWRADTTGASPAGAAAFAPGTARAAGCIHGKRASLRIDQEKPRLAAGSGSYADLKKWIGPRSERDHDLDRLSV